MKTLYIMCGCPGSGKTTWAKKMVNALVESGKTVNYLSRDDVRKAMLKDKEAYFSKETEVFKSFTNQLNMWINDSSIDCIIADATHLNKKSRYKLLVNLNITNNVEVCAIALETPLEVCLERNSNRVGFAYVPEDALINMFNSYERPTIDEKWIKQTIIERG